RSIYPFRLLFGDCGLERLLHLPQGLGDTIGQGVDRTRHHEKIRLVGHGVVKLIAKDRACAQEVENVVDRHRLMGSADDRFWDHPLYAAAFTLELAENAPRFDK